jgi:hypothetical protein
MLVGMVSRVTLALAGLLAASIALNVRLCPRPSAHPPASVPVASARPAPAPPPGSEPEECPQRLAACEQRSWEIVRRAIAAGGAPQSGAERPRSDQARAPSKATPAEEQDRALCKKAKEGLREQWRRDRDAIAENLTKSLDDAPEQERSAANEAEKMRIAAALDDREAAIVARAYRDARLARVAEARAALGQGPRDFAGLLAAARGLYTDEDAILERIGGPAARDAWRAEAVEGRTILLALVAAMADRNWEGDIRW